MRYTKIIVLLCITGLFLISCSENVPAETQNSKGVEETNTSSEIATRQLTINDKNASTNDATATIVISYPEIVGLGDETICRKINHLLYSCALNYYQKTDHYMALLPVVQGNLDVNVSYEILSQCENFLSLKYEECISYYRVNKSVRFLTIDLKTGELMSILDVVDLPSIQTDINNGDYTILNGTYSPEGWNGYEEYIREDFIDVMQKIYNCQDGTDKNFYNEDNNFGLDESGLYLCFNYSDSLNGYVILHFEGKGTVSMNPK